MSVDDANAQDMLFLTRLMAIGASDCTFDKLAQQLITQLIEGLGVDAAAILQFDGDNLRPLAWHGLELEKSSIIHPSNPPESTSPDRVNRIRLTLPLVHHDHPFGTLYLYIAESNQLASRLHDCANTSDAYYNSFLQAIAYSISISLFNRKLQHDYAQVQFQLHSIVDTIPIAVSVFDSDRKMLLANKQARGFVGRTQWAEIEETPTLYQICDPAGNPLPTDEWPFLKAIRQPKLSINQEYVLDFGDYQRRLILTVIPVRMSPDEPPIFISFGEDITARTELDRRKDDFLTVASHELRSPLTPLLGFMQMARHQAESKQPVDIDVLLRAERQAHRIRRLLEGLLDFSRIETGRLQLVCREVDLVEQLSLILEPWYSVSESKKSFIVMLSKVPLFVMADPDRLEQVVTNIIDNALKHGKPDGIISVSASKSDNQAVLEISNDANGAPCIDVDHVFDRFYQKNKNSGTFRTSMGLGLYISRQIIEQHGGTIEMQCDSDGLTTVKIVLPLIEDPVFDACSEHTVSHP